MCGILAVIGKIDKEIVQAESKLLSHRGPDESGVLSTDHYVLAHERLSIIDLTSGIQPIVDRDMAVIHNGEIYNHKALKDEFKVSFKTKSDSESILHGYSIHGEDIVHKLDGIFAFVVVHEERFLVARDPIGVKPLYYGKDQEGRLWFASEQKALTKHCVWFKEFLPGHLMTEKDLEPRRWFEPLWFKGECKGTDASLIKKTFIDAVEKRLMSDVEVGALLSGGLDSSLVASIASRALKRMGKTLKTFSVGMSVDSPDLIRAREVATFIGSDHTEVVFSFDEGLATIRELIYKTESYDVTTTRAATPMYIMSKVIQKKGIKVVLSGEGADEMFGGYLYFSHAPCAKDFHKESLRRVKRLHTSDVLRADRATAGLGIEARVPFLDLKFLDVVMNIDPSLKLITDSKMEKHILREAFDDKSDPWLPDSVLWRQKEQFSDGVGYSWIDGLKEYADFEIDTEKFSQAHKLFSHNTPTTKEAFLYRTIYEEFYSHPSCALIIKKWIPKWQDYNADPSGRANKLHTATYGLAV